MRLKAINSTAILDIRFFQRDHQWHGRVTGEETNRTFCNEYFMSFAEYKEELAPGDRLCTKCEWVIEMIQEASQARKL